MIKSVVSSLTKITRTKIGSLGAIIILTGASLTGAVPLLMGTASANPVVTVCASGCDYPTIQDGVDNVDADGTVNVGAGTYTEAVSVTKSVHIVGAGEGTTTIVAPASLPNAASGGSVITIDGAAVSAEVSGLTVSGPGPSSCGSIFAGIFVRGAATANLHGIAVSDIADNPIGGCQNGVGIYVGRNAFATTGNATINDVTISGYQKAGIVVDNTGSSADIENSSITGAGAVGFIAQNGVQVSRGATAIVTGNTISDNSYTGADTATGILLYGAADGTTVGPNTVTGNQLGLYVDTPGQLTNLDISGISGNTRNAIADVNDPGDPYSDGNWPTPLATTYADSSISGVVNSDGNDIVTTGGGSHVYGYDAFNNIQSAVNAAAAGGTVHVSAGTYSGDVTIPVDNLTLQADGAATINLGSGYGINLDNGTAITGFTMTGFTVNASPSTTYAFKAYKADGLTLTNDTFNGSSPSTGGGVDINTTSNVTITNVSSNNFHKNGFAFTAQFAAGDTPSSNIALSGITSTGNGWSGIAFYTANGAGTVGNNITGVTFSGSNSLTNNGNQGLFIEGDNDSNFGSLATPRWTVTGPSGAQLDLGTTAFSGNGNGDPTDGDIVNYQTSGIQALSATFGGLTGDQMNSSQRSAEDSKIIDKLDDSALGYVKYYSTVVTVNNLTTDDTTPALSGTVSDKNASVTVTVNGHTYVANVSSTANGSGTYDWNVGVADALPVGTYDVVATATDPGGNVSHDGTTNELTITAPSSSGGGSSSGSGSSSSGSSSSGGSGSGTGGTNTATSGGRGGGLFGLGFGAGVGQVLGTTTTNPSNSNNSGSKGQVKSASITKHTATGSSDKAFLGLGWWWLLVLLAILVALIYWLYRRRRNDEEV